MKRQFWVLLLVGLLLGLAQPAWSDDMIVVAGGRGVGTAITPTTSLPYTISQPGFYYLTGNLSYTSTSGNAITIAASEVTLDLMGFSLAGFGSYSGNGIHINSTLINVEVRNGSVKYFSIGINSAGGGGSNRRLANLRVSGCNTGISDASIGTIITSCQAANNTNVGISTGPDVILDKNTAYHNTNIGFFLMGGGIVTNNAARSNGTGFQLAGGASLLVDRNSSNYNDTNWTGLTGCTVGLNTP